MIRKSFQHAESEFEECDEISNGWKFSFALLTEFPCSVRFLGQFLHQNEQQQRIPRIDTNFQRAQRVQTLLCVVDKIANVGNRFALMRWLIDKSLQLDVNQSFLVCETRFERVPSDGVIVVSDVCVPENDACGAT